MGMFSWECKGCDQELVQGELVRLNGCKGEYDGYGGVGGECIDYDPVAWHQKCYGEATVDEKLDETPSKHARNQGFGFPRQDCMPEGSTYEEPPRVKYAEVRKADIREYLEGLFAEEDKKEDGGYWCYTNQRDKTGRFSLADVTDEDFAAMRAEFGERFAHDHMDEDDRKERGGEFWGDFDPGDHYFAMRDRFQGRHHIVSELAHEVLRFTRKRLS